MNVQTQPINKSIFTVMCMTATLCGVATQMGWFTSYGDPIVCIAIFIGITVLSSHSRTSWPPLFLIASLAFGFSKMSGMNPAILVLGSLSTYAVMKHPQGTTYPPSVRCFQVTLATASTGAVLWWWQFLSPNNPWISVGLGAMIGWTMSVWTWPWLTLSREPSAPTVYLITRKLQKPFRDPVLQGLTLYKQATKQDIDHETREGLGEIVRWLYHVQRSTQCLTQQRNAIHPEDVQRRIDALPTHHINDTFITERNLATKDHLTRLLQHRDRIGLELDRNQAMVLFAVAFLEETLTSIHVSSNSPVEWVPDRLPIVLERLRKFSNHRQATNAMKREMSGFSYQSSTNSRRTLSAHAHPNVT